MRGRGAEADAGGSQRELAGSPACHAGCARLQAAEPFPEAQPKGCGRVSPKAGRSLRADAPAVAHLPPALRPSAPRGHPTVHLLFTFQKVRWRHQEVGRRHASGKQTSAPHPDPPVPGLWPGSCHVTAPGTTGPGNEVSFYSVSALLAKRTVAPNRISFLINKEERQRGCWVGEYQFPPRGPSPSVAMLPAVIVFVTGRPRPHLLAAFPSWKLQARALLISFTAEFSRPRGQSGL